MSRVDKIKFFENYDRMCLPLYDLLKKSLVTVCIIKLIIMVQYHNKANSGTTALWPQRMQKKNMYQYYIILRPYTQNYGAL